MSRARDEIMELAQSFSLTTEFPDAVMAEVQRCLTEPGLDDPALSDATDRPFVTIDNEDSRDLDQALFVEARGEGHLVHYALADASYYVRPGSALYAEALSRGASFYLPGFVVPMLPVELSEGLVSLNPEVDRRAVVFLVELDGRGEVVSTRIERQRIRSRAKLSYVGVQHFWDAPTSNHLENRDFTDSLWALREVGRRRVALAEAGGVVQYPRIEVDIGFTDSEGRRFHAFESRRTECDRANEQLSLLVNVEGARLLERHVRDTGDPNIAAVYRVHPAPAPSTLAALAATSRQVLEHHGLPLELAWLMEEEPLSRWLARLTAALGRHPVALALQRQALLVNQRSTFAPEPGLHYGVGAPCYARFSSPMREVVGIHTHREALEALGLEPTVAVAEGERAAIVAAANRAKDIQHTLTQRANQLVLASMFTRDLEHSPASRPRRSGTVMGVTKDRLFVLLDSPPLDLKVYARDLGAVVQHVGDTLTVDGVTFALGDGVDVRVEHFDPQRDRFALSATLVTMSREADPATPVATSREADPAPIKDARP